MREVTGYYYMSCWRYEAGPHRIRVIANERRHAAEAVEMFLNGHGYPGGNLDSITRKLKNTRSINSTHTVIVADFHRESEDEYADGTPVPD